MRPKPGRNLEKCICVGCSKNFRWCSTNGKLPNSILLCCPARSSGKLCTDHSSASPSPNAVTARAGKGGDLKLLWQLVFSPLSVLNSMIKDYLSGYIFKTFNYSLQNIIRKFTCFKTHWANSITRQNRRCCLYFRPVRWWQQTPSVHNFTYASNEFTTKGSSASLLSVHVWSTSISPCQGLAHGLRSDARSQERTHLPHNQCSQQHLDLTRVSLLVWFTVELQDPKRATTGCCRWASSGAISFKAAICVQQQKLCYRRPQFHSSLLPSKKVPQLLPSKKSVSLPSRQICFRSAFRGRNPLASVQRQLLNYLYKVQPEVQPRDTPWTPRSIILEEQRQRNESDTNSKLQHFIAALAKVRFLKLVKIGRHFCMKCYNFTSLSSYMQKPKNSGRKNFKRARKKRISNIQMSSLTELTTSTWKQTKIYANK